MPGGESMNSEELKASLQPYYDNYDEIGVTVYAILKDAETPGPRKIDIEAGASDGLKTLFIQSLRDTISDREDLSVLNLSASDERAMQFINTISTCRKSWRQWSPY